MTAQNLKSHTYCATLPNGKIITRKTTREYSHVVAILTYPYTGRGNPPATEKTWGFVGWAGRPDLAQKLAAKYTTWSHTDAEGKSFAYDVQATIIPVDNPRTPS